MILILIRALVTIGLFAAIAGCGREKTEKAPPAAAPQPAVAGAVTSEARDADPLRVTVDLWSALTSTNVAAVVALSLDEGLDLKADDVEGRLRARRCREFVEAAAMRYRNASFGPSAIVETRNALARVTTTVTLSSGETEQTDCVLRKTDGKWRVDLFTEKGL